MSPGSWSSLVMAAVLAALALAPVSPARAGVHQICYRDLTLPKEPLAVSAHCRSDVPGVSCTIVPPKGLVRLSKSGTAASRSETYRGLSAMDVYRFEFRFSNGVVRACAVEMGVPQAQLEPQGRLVGYTTDRSGLAMAGVWMVTWTDHDPTTWGAEPNVGVPSDFVVTGGGGVGAEWPSGALLTQTYGSADAWRAQTRQLLSQDVYTRETYGIALKIGGMAHADLKSVMSHFSESSNPLVGHHLSATALLPPDWLLVGGGARAISGSFLTGEPPFHQFLTTDAPVLQAILGCLEFDPNCRPVYAIDGWTAASKDHIVSSSGSLWAYAHVIRPELLIGGSRFVVEQCASAATSPVAPHPSVVVAGFPVNAPSPALAPPSTGKPTVPRGTCCGSSCRGPTSPERRRPARTTPFPRRPRSPRTRSG